MGFTESWSALCPPAKLYPIVMTSVVLFNVYRGTYKHAIVQSIHALIGTVLLAVLCASGFEVAAWILLLLPVLFFVFLLALLFYDQSLFDIRRSYGPLGPDGCRREEEEPKCDPNAEATCCGN